MNIPKVSVIIPSYNHSSYVTSAIDSVLDQNYGNLEVIVIDDESTDDSLDLLLAYGDRIKLISQSNIGQAATRNKGIHLASGEYIAFLDSDDLYMPGKIHKQIKCFEDFPEVDVVYTDYCNINTSGEIISVVKCPSYTKEAFPKAMLAGNFICNATVMVRRSFFSKAGYFNEDIAPTTDLEMWLRFCAHGAHFYHLSSITVKYRIHSLNQSRNFLLMRRFRDIAHLMALKEFNCKGYYLADYELKELSNLFARQLSFCAAAEALKRSLVFRSSILSLLKYRALFFLDNSLTYHIFDVIRKFVKFVRNLKFI